MNFIFGIVCLIVYVYAFSLRRESPDMILRDKPLISEVVLSQGMTHIRRMMREGDPKINYFREDAEGILWFKDRLVVLKKEMLQKKVLDEAHTSRYSIHPGSTKMYHDLRQ
jgi:uncharacterized protein (UPF0128 family)